MDRCGIFAEVILEFHEVAPAGLAYNTGKFRVGEAISDGFDGESHAVCCCCARNQLMSALSL